jgi:hypothetical protein
MHSLQVIFYITKILLIVSACRQIVINKRDKKKYFKGGKLEDVEWIHVAQDEIL